VVELKDFLPKRNEGTFLIILEGIIGVFQSTVGGGVVVGLFDFRNVGQKVVFSKSLLSIIWQKYL
jgi:hypothetical protein